MSKQYKVTHEEASVISYALDCLNMTSWFNHHIPTRDEAGKIYSVLDELKKRMDDQSKDYRDGRRSHHSLRYDFHKLHEKYFGRSILP